MNDLCAGQDEGNEIEMEIIWECAEEVHQCFGTEGTKGWS